MASPTKYRSSFPFASMFSRWLSDVRLASFDDVRSQWFVADALASCGGVLRGLVVAVGIATQGGNMPELCTSFLA